MKKLYAAWIIGVIAALSARAVTIDIIQDDSTKLDFIVSWDWDVAHGTFGDNNAAFAPSPEVQDVITSGKNNSFIIFSSITSPYFSTIDRGSYSWLTPQLYVQLTSSLTMAEGSVNVTILAAPPPWPPLPWWDIPTVLEGVPGNPYALHVVYDRSNEPVPEGSSTLAYAGLALVGIGVAARKLKLCQ